MAGNEGFFALSTGTAYDHEMNLRALLMATAVLASAAGCAPTGRTDVADLQRQLQSMRQQTSRDQQQIDELENRIFVLEDKLETAEVDRGRASQQAPRLPVVKKQALAVPDGDSGDAEPAGDDDATEEEVVYEGAAARDDGPRPQLYLEDEQEPNDVLGDDGTTPRRRVHARPTPVAREDRGGYPDPKQVTDRIPTKRVAAAPDAGDDPLSAYKAAYAMLGRREHEAAIAAFTSFLDRWPEHDYADNAQYWLGEAWYDQRDYGAALTEFHKVVRRYPSGNKAPDALLKIGYCHVKLGDAANARDVLSQVIEIYPKTEAAKLAAKRLDEMRQ